MYTRIWLIYAITLQYALTQCWFDVGPPSSTLAQHQTNIESMSHVFSTLLSCPENDDIRTTEADYNQKQGPWSH